MKYGRQTILFFKMFYEDPHSYTYVVHLVFKKGDAVQNCMTVAGKREIVCTLYVERSGYHTIHAYIQRFSTGFKYWVVHL
jgi:hypothetical protein